METMISYYLWNAILDSFQNISGFGGGCILDDSHALYGTVRQPKLGHGLL